MMLDKIREKESGLCRSRLLEVLAYDPITGVFTWKVRVMAKLKVGQVAGTLNTNGHRQITLDGVTWVAHRLAWFYVHGVWPENEIDHEDLNKDNNALGNLREATHAQNCNNRKASPLTNTSGFKGVSHKDGKWQAQIKCKGKNYHLGYFDDPAIAHQAYVTASKKYHGNFSRTN